MRETCYAMRNVIHFLLLQPEARYSGRCDQQHGSVVGRGLRGLGAQACPAVEDDAQGSIRVEHHWARGVGQNVRGRGAVEVQPGHSIETIRRKGYDVFRKAGRLVSQTDGCGLDSAKDRSVRSRVGPRTAAARQSNRFVLTVPLRGRLITRTSGLCSEDTGVIPGPAAIS